MSFRAVRRFLFQVHMWIGLVLGLLLVLLGLSGSILVYDDKVADLLDPPPAATAVGAPLPLDRLIAAARAAAPAQGQMQLVMPEGPGEAASVRIGQMSRMGPPPGGGRRPRATEVFVDPVSGAVLGTRTALQPGILTFAHQLHGNFLMGRDGRSKVVGPLGVAMLLLGLSGIVLWWPKPGQWKYAFIVRRTAKGLRFHRELHAMVGIWALFVFMVVSFSGVVLAWPQAFGPAPGFNPRAAPHVEPQEGATPLGADAAAAMALKALPDARLRMITMPARPDQPVTVSLLAHDAINATVTIDPWRGQVMSVRDPSGSFLAWQRPVHQGTLGPVWKFLVFLSGFLPLLFVVTGVVMWAKKRRARIAMTAPLIEEGIT
jgi:uncharacterized iron-regulated membrane protein